MQSDYISRHAAIIEMMDNDVDHAQGTDGREVVQILSAISAADVVPVVHGKWIVSHIPDSMLWECDQCGFDCGAHSFNFCPNCGAKMDGKE